MEAGAVANLTASRVSLERMRKIRFFQRSGYISLDLARGTGEYLRLREGVDLGEGPVTAASLEGIVERIQLRGDGVEPLRRELDSFLAAVRRENEVTVSGRDGRHALAVALQIVDRIDTRHVADPVTA